MSLPGGWPPSNILRVLGQTFCLPPRLNSVVSGMLSALATVDTAAGVRASSSKELSPTGELLVSVPTRLCCPMLHLSDIQEQFSCHTTPAAYSCVLPCYVVCFQHASGSGDRVNMPAQWQLWCVMPLKRHTALGVTLVTAGWGTLPGCSQFERILERGCI